MGRIAKTGLDYFPTDVDIFSDEKIEFISAKFGLEGEAIIFRLLAKIYRNGYYIEWNEDVKLLFTNKLKSKATKLGDFVDKIIEECFKRKLFNKEKYEEFGILTSSGIQKRYLRICKDAKRKIIPFEIDYGLIPINSEDKDIDSEETGINPGFSAQSKVKKSKVQESTEKKSKVKYSKENPGTKNEDLTPTIDTSPSLPTSYLFTEDTLTPKKYADDKELRAIIVLMLAQYCNEKEPDRATVTRFFNILTNTENPVKKGEIVSRKFTHKIALETFKEYKSYDEERRNLPYLSKRIIGKISDAMIVAKEKVAAQSKAVESKESAAFAESIPDLKKRGRDPKEIPKGMNSIMSAIKF